MKFFEKAILIFLVGVFILIAMYLYKLPFDYIIGLGILIVIIFVAQKYLVPNIPRKEPMKSMIDFVKQWWYNDMRTGEHLTYIEGTGIEGYFGNERIYGFTLIRPSYESELLVVVGTSPRRIMVWKDVPAQSDKTPFDIFKDTFGIRPLPSSRIDITKHKEYYGRKRVIRKEIREKEEEEVVK